MKPTIIELEQLKAALNTKAKFVYMDRNQLKQKIDYIIKRTQDGDLPYQEAIKLPWIHICLFSEENVWYLIKKNQVTIAEVMGWNGRYISTVAHALITERLNHPDIVQWIHYIASALGPIFDKPKITPLVQENIIPWEALLQLRYLDEMSRLLLNDEVLDFLSEKAFTFEELKTEKAAVILLAKGWVTREELTGYTEKQRNLLISDSTKYVLSHEQNHGRITASDLLSFNEIQLAFVSHIWPTILGDTRHTAATIRKIPLTTCTDILENYRFSHESKLGIYETQDVERILNSCNPPPVSPYSSVSLFNNTKNRHHAQIEDEAKRSSDTP